LTDRFISVGGLLPTLEKAIKASDASKSSLQLKGNTPSKKELPETQQFTELNQKEIPGEMKAFGYQYYRARDDS
jgi:hypothetical protein